MKKLLAFTLVFAYILMAGIMTSCSCSGSYYPRYKLDKEYILPASSEDKYKEYIKELIELATKNKNSDASDVIEEARNTAKELYCLYGLCLYKQVNSSTHVIIYPKDFTEKEKEISKSLNKSGNDWYYINLTQKHEKRQIHK